MRHSFPIGYAALAVLFAVRLTACDRSAPRDGAPILLFAGTGTSTGDVAAVEQILDDNHLAYATATSSQLNAMSASQLAAYRLVIVPGGDFIHMSASLTPGTTARIHEAVQGGVNY